MDQFEQRCNQDNLNISVGIQYLLTCMYRCGVWNVQYKGNEFCTDVVYEMYNIKEMSFAGVFACSVDLYKLHFWWWSLHIAKTYAIINKVDGKNNEETWEIWANTYYFS
jgi:hypothetical protein